MVLAGDAGHHMKKIKLLFICFSQLLVAQSLGLQAWEWKTLSMVSMVQSKQKRSDLRLQYRHWGKVNEFAAVSIPTDRAQHQSKLVLVCNRIHLPTYSLDEVKAGFLANDQLLIKTQQNDEQGHKIVLNRKDSINKISQAVYVVEGANLIRNEYGSPLFGNFFFFITGFHGFHVFTGVLINLIIFFNVVIGTYEKRGHYEMVEKVGLYWHFVDLVWVFVFTFFYLV